MEIRKGSRYRAISDVSVLCATHWTAPFTGGQKVVLPKGEVLVVLDDPPSYARGTYLRPERYDELMETLVDPRERQADGFSGYSLVVSFDDLRTSFVEVV